MLAPFFMLGEVSMDLLQPRLMAAIVDEGVLGLSSGGVGDMGLVVQTGCNMCDLFYNQSQSYVRRTAG